MIHQQPPIESPATQALPVQPGRSSQQHTASAHSRVDVARLCERLDCIEDKLDELGITQQISTLVSSTVSIEALMKRIETLRGLFEERIACFPVCDNAQETMLEKTSHIN